MPTPQEDHTIRLLEDAYRRWVDAPPVGITMDAGQRDALEAGVDLLLRHPDLPSGLLAALMRIRPALAADGESPAELVRIEMAHRDVWELVGGLQLLLRHPQVAEAPPLADFFERFGRTLQNSVADDADLYALLETGWNPDLDVPQ